MMKLKYSNCDETQKLKLWWNSTQIVMKLKNSNCGETQKTQIAMKLKNSDWDETQIVRKLKNLNIDKTQIVAKLNLWQNSNTQTLTKLKNQIVKNCIMTNLSLREEEKIIKSVLERTFWHLVNRWDVLWAAFCNSCDVFKLSVLCQRQSIKPAVLKTRLGKKSVYGFWHLGILES